MGVKIAAITILATLVVWLPFVLKIQSLPGWGLDFSKGMKAVWSNFDGPNYLVVAKSWYDKSFIAKSFSSPLKLEYYPAHLPLYPAIIWLLDIFLPGPTAMLLTTLIGNALASVMFLAYINQFKLSKNAKWLVIASLLIPARFLAVRSVGSPETWFIFFILASLFCFKKQNYLLAGFWGALAQLTKSPGILLFGGYLIYFFIEAIQTKKIAWKKYLKASPLLLIPLAVLALFSFYSIRTGDFLAYFHSGDNFHLFWPPFSIFTPKGHFWTGDFWLEEVIWLWLIYGLGIMKLWQKKLKIEAVFAGLFFSTTLFIAHRDIARYILPVAPLILIGWERTIQKKEFKIMLAILVIPIFLYTWNFLLNNQAPIADWAPYL